MNGIVTKQEAAVLHRKAEEILGDRLLATTHYNKYFQVVFLREKDVMYQFPTSYVWVLSIKGEVITLGIHDVSNMISYAIESDNPFYSK